MANNLISMQRGSQARVKRGQAESGKTGNAVPGCGHCGVAMVDNVLKVNVDLVDIMFT